MVERGLSQVLFRAFLQVKPHMSSTTLLWTKWLNHSLKSSRGRDPQQDQAVQFGMFKCLCILDDICVLDNCLMSWPLCVRSVPAAAGPVLPNGPARILNPDVIKRELQRLQHVSRQAHISRSVMQLLPKQQMTLHMWIETPHFCFFLMKSQV